MPRLLALQELVHSNSLYSLWSRAVEHSVDCLESKCISFTASYAANFALSPFNPSNVSEMSFLTSFSLFKSVCIFCLELALVLLD